MLVYDMNVLQSSSEKSLLLIRYYKIFQGACTQTIGNIIFMIPSKDQIGLVIR